MQKLCALFLLATACALSQSVPSGYSLTGAVNGSAVDYWPSHQTISGDTQYCTQTAATYANGVSAGTSILNRNDGNGNVTISGKILCTLNDGAYGGTGGNIVLYYLNTLDLSNAANISTSLANAMSTYGTASGATNVPAGWFGKVTSQNLTYNLGNWKSDQPISVNGWVLLPVFRQEVGSNYYAHDLTFIASPDGGAHWMNPYSYWHQAVSNVACAANVVTLTTATNTFQAGGGDVIWVHGANTGANGQFTTTAATSVSVSYAAPCSGVTTGASSGYASLTDPNGDAPICGASAYSSTCQNAAYLDGTHSSMMWQEPSPYNGLVGFMQSVKFFDYCQDNSCTGMPNSADTTLYMYGCDGKRSTCGLAKVAKAIDSIMNPASFSWYSQSSYSPANVGTGTSWTTTESSATVMWGYQNPTYSAAIPATPINLGAVQGSPSYLCAGTSCSYVTTAQATILFTSQAPWGPFFSTSLGPLVAQGFPHLLPYTAATIDSAPYHLRLASTWDNYFWGVTHPVTAVTKGNPTLLTTVAPASWAAAPVYVTVAGETAACWTAINGGRNATYVNSTTVSVPVDTTACTGSATGTITWQGQAINASQYWQNYDLTLAPSTLGASLLGNSGVRFSMGPAETTMSRNGLQYYFDFWDNLGVASAPGGAIAAVDISHFPPTSVLSPCYTNGSYGGCGFYSTSYQTAWNAFGLYHYGAGYTLGLELQDLTAAQAQISPSMFSGDAAWTITETVKLNAVSGGNQCFFCVEGASTQVRLYLLSSGVLRLDLGTGSLNVVSTSSSLFSAGTWANLTVTRVPGTGAGKTVFYLNGSAVSVTTNVASAPNVTVGPAYVGAAIGGAWPALGTFAATGVWNRALSSTEVAEMYRTQKALMARRGVSLP